MLKLADLVDEHSAEFARLEALSMGKPVSTYLDTVMGTATLRCLITLISLLRSMTVELGFGNRLTDFDHRLRW